MDEFFTVILNSTNATNLSKNGTNYISNDCTFTVNWAGIIPEKYRNNSFMVTFSFISSVTNQQALPLLINVDGLSLNNRDQGQNRILGCIKPIIFYSGTQQIMFAGITDNIPVVIQKQHRLEYISHKYWMEIYHHLVWLIMLYH